MSGSEKLVAVGLGTAVVLGVTVLAYSVSECRRFHRKWAYSRTRFDRDVARVMAAERGCDWAQKVA